MVRSGSFSSQVVRPAAAQATGYSAAEEMPVPALSHDPAVLRAELERATAAGDWLRVAELARVLALALC